MNHTARPSRPCFRDHRSAAFTWTLVALAVATVLPGCAGHADALYATTPSLRPGAHRDIAPASDREDVDAQPALRGLSAMLTHQLAHAPSIRAAEERLRAALARVPQAARLPDLSVEFAWLPMPVETRVGPNDLRLGLKQMIPFPSKIVSHVDIADAQARRAATVFDREVRDAMTELKLAYADLAYLQRALTVLAQNEEIATAISSLGATRQAEGSGVLADIARAQSQLAQLQYDRITLEERHGVARAKINALLGRAPGAPLEVEPLPVAAVELSEDALIERALANQQELAGQDYAIAAAEAKLDLARASWLPDFAVGAQWMRQTPSAMRPEPADSGKDALAVTFGLSLPIWGYANNAAVEEADAELVATIYDKKVRLDSLPAQVRAALYQERNAARLRTLYDEELLPHASAALLTADQASQQDTAGYADLLEARAAYYSFSLARERAAADHFQAVARLEQLVGVVFAVDDFAAAQDASEQGTAPSPDEGTGEQRP